MDKQIRSYASRLMDEQPQLRAASKGLPRATDIKKKKEVKIDDETLYVAEGDLLLDEDQLDLHVLAQASLEQVQNLGFAPMPEGLVGILEAGKIVRWHPNVVLSYAVLRSTFPSQQKYDMVVANMKKATGDWERTCGVKFEHRSALDGTAPGAPAACLFTVRCIDAGGQFIAAAFFPNDPKNRRRVLIDPSYFTPGLTFDTVGVLRHELGHALGFRHEHIRSGAPAVCPDEGTDGTINLSAYDPKSVMHYFCGGVGSRTLDITQIDRDASQKVYGPPLNQLALYE